MTVPWWQQGVIYQVYPRSFADGSGDGVGDLGGLAARLDHLTWLGVDGLWLSPIFRSPMADFGYDVSDYHDIDPVFGTLADFDELVADAHGQGLKVMLDWVPNHTSDQHAWFLASRSSRDDPKRAWYVWRDRREDNPSGRPNNWRAAFGGRAWTWDEATGQWYLHLFLPQQPDLNWANPEVVDAMHGVLRFWLDRGVDGFRADVVHLIGKDPELPDQPEDLEHENLVSTNDHPATHRLLRGIRAVLDGYPGDRAMVGEVNLRSAALVAPYYGMGDELHLVFNFSLLWAPWDAAAWGELVEASEHALAPRQAWPVWVLANHDVPRLRSRLGGSEAKARVAAVLLLTLRGTPFLYAGEELGLLDAEIPADRIVDPGLRDGCRAPLPWTAEPGHSWPVEPWLPWPPEAAERSVVAERADHDSVLWLHRRLLRARRASPALHAGTWTRLTAPEGVLAYERAADGEVRRVLANFTPNALTLSKALVEDPWRIEVSTAVADEGHRWDGTLRGEQAVVLAPA